MKLYLVQHGEAVSEEENPDRPLTDQGHMDVRQVGEVLSQAEVEVSLVLHSGKKRAQQTAGILASAVGFDNRLEDMAGIGPNDSPTEFANIVRGWSEDTMVVGHMPFMAKLVSLLVAGDEAAWTVAFTPGTIVCLEQQEEHKWTIAWMIRPELVT